MEKTTVEQILKMDMLSALKVIGNLSQEDRFELAKQLPSPSKSISEILRNSMKRTPDKKKVNANESD